MTLFGFTGGKDMWPSIGLVCSWMCDALNSGGPVDNPSTRGNLWISGSRYHTHMSHILRSIPV